MAKRAPKPPAAPPPKLYSVLEMEQLTPEWFTARLGRLTGSRAEHAISFLKDGKESAARRDYRIQLALERITGQCGDEVNLDRVRWVQRGRATEPLAVATYEALTSEMIRRCGFVSRTDLMAGASVDGYVGEITGILETKCPKSFTHIKYIRGPEMVPAEHLAQCIHGLWVSGAEWVDFFSFDDRLVGLEDFLVRLHREDCTTALAQYDEQARAFLAEVDKEVASIGELVQQRRKKR